MPNLKLSQLEMAYKIAKDDKGPKIDYNQQEDLESFVIGLIKSNICSTIGIKYEIGSAYVTCVYPSETKLMKFDCFEEEYNKMCETLGIDLNEKYNCSKTRIIDGTRTRVYAVMTPFVEYPNITLSTTKEPPSKLNKQTIPDEAWEEIVHSNFIIVGPSGSGKTYLMNYLLNKYIKPIERIALIEEFGELIPPNPLTISITVPPPKPNEKHLLQFMTEQANLMRLDMTCVGEIKGAEAWPFVIQGASGTRVACTMHGENLPQALNRLRALCQQSCDNVDAIDEFIAKSIRYAIIMKNKQIVRIEKLTGTHNHNNFAAQEIFS